MRSFASASTSSKEGEQGAKLAEEKEGCCYGQTDGKVLAIHFLAVALEEV